MELDDLRRLKMAIDTGNINHFHGDMSQAFIDVVNELIEVKENKLDTDDVIFEALNGLTTLEDRFSDFHDEVSLKLKGINDKLKFYDV